MKAAILGTSVLTAASWAYIRHIQLPIGPSRVSWGPLVVGHRGCREIAGVPENTLAAFEYARSNGAGGVEIDIRLTRDDELVVFHDAFLGTTMAGQRDPTTRVDQLDLTALKAMHYAADQTGQVRVPTLEETVLYCRDNNLKLYIEVKELRRPRVCVEKLLALYKKYPDFMYTETTVIGFSPFVLHSIRKRDHRIAVGQLHSGEVLQTLVNHKVDACPPLIALCPRFFDWILNFVQTRISPWISGVSTMCPHRHLVDNAYKNRWQKRAMNIYVWGFKHPEECTPLMRGPSFVACVDDSFESYKPDGGTVSYKSLFPDAPSVQAQAPLLGQSSSSEKH